MQNEPPAPFSPSGDDAAVVLVLGLGVAGAVDEAGEVEAVAVDERRRLTGDGHVARDRVAELPLRLPAEVLVGRVDPEEQLLLGALGDLAVGRLVARVGLEVVRDVVGEVGEERRAEQDAHVDRDGHAGLGAGGAGVRDGLLDHPEVGAVGAAEVRVPLVLLEVGEDRVLGVGHVIGSPGSFACGAPFLAHDAAECIRRPGRATSRLRSGRSRCGHADASPRTAAS